MEKKLILSAKQLQQEKELIYLLERVVSLKNHLHGEGNWSKKLLPKTIEGCKTFINYCDKEYGVLG